MHEKLLVAANWKMHPAPEGFDAGNSPYRPRGDVDVVVFPTFLDLYACIEADLATGGQCGRPEPTGAFTGDISVQMVKDAGCTFILCGHSDRRRFHGETDEFVAAQASAALEIGLIPIVCVGETAEERAAGKTEEVIRRQMHTLNIQHSTFNIPPVLAYEPVWAISRGDPNKPAATTRDAEEMHALIRSLLPGELRDQIRIIYGGSMKAANAEELLKQPNIDGGLVGNASLNPEEFRTIVEAAARAKK
jgi:triosephosphate isomerase